MGASSHHHAGVRFPLPTTEEWGEGKGEDSNYNSRANSMEGALSPALSLLVPRRERERGACATVVVSRCARRPHVPMSALALSGQKRVIVGCRK